MHQKGAIVHALRPGQWEAMGNSAGIPNRLGGACDAPCDHQGGGPWGKEGCLMTLSQSATRLGPAHLLGVLVVLEAHEAEAPRLAAVVRHDADAHGVA